MNCAATGPSRAIEGHTHVCSGTHQDGMHKCVSFGCRRWFAGAAPERDRAAEVEAAEDRAEQAAFDAAREREYDPAEDNYGRTPQSPHDAWKGGRP